MFSLEAGIKFLSFLKITKKRHLLLVFFFFSVKAQQFGAVHRANIALVNASNSHTFNFSPQCFLLVNKLFGIHLAGSAGLHLLTLAVHFRNRWGLRMFLQHVELRGCALLKKKKDILASTKDLSASLHIISVLHVLNFPCIIRGMLPYPSTY